MKSEHAPFPTSRAVQHVVTSGSKPTCGVAAFRSGLASLCAATQMAAASPEADPKVLARICDN